MGSPGFIFNSEDDAVVEQRLVEIPTAKTFPNEPPILGRQF